MKKPKAPVKTSKKPPPKKASAMPSHGDAVKMAEAALGDTEF